MRNLAPGVRGGKHERSRRRDPDSEEPQTAGHRSPVRGRWVSGHPDRRSRTEGRRCLYRHAQRAGRLLRGAGLRLSDRPPRAIAACVVHDRPVIHLSGDSAIGFSGMEMETLVRYNFPAKIVVLNNGGIGPGMPEIPESPMFNMKPNALIYGARYDRVMEAFGGKGFFVEDPKDLRGALD